MSNSVTLVGNLVEDPELRFTASGVAMARIRIAVSRRYQDRDGTWQEESSFFGGTVWRDHAENVAESLTKGTRVILSGRLKQRSWETNEGEKRSVVEIDIQEIGPSLRAPPGPPGHGAPLGDRQRVPHPPLERGWRFVRRWLECPGTRRTHRFRPRRGSLLSPQDSKE